MQFVRSLGTPLGHFANILTKCVNRQSSLISIERSLLLTDSETKKIINYIKFSFEQKIHMKLITR